MSRAATKKQQIDKLSLPIGSTACVYKKKRGFFRGRQALRPTIVLKIEPTLFDKGNTYIYLVLCNMPLGLFLLIFFFSTVESDQPPGIKANDIY